MANYAILGIHPEETAPGPEIVPVKPKGEPYARVKEKARYMTESLWDDGYKQGHFAVDQIIAKLIETAPQQTLDALCEVLDPDGK